MNRYPWRMSEQGEAADVSVVVVTYESGGTLGLCLSALKAQVAQGFETILSDNGSTDRAAQAAASADRALTLVENGSNLGFAAGNNRAAERANGRWLVLLNPDAYPEPGFIAALLAAASAHPKVRCFTALQRMAGDPSRLDGLGDAMTVIGFPFRAGYGRPDPGGLEPAEVFSPCGAAMMIDRAMFLRMGGFDERFFCYCEDVDLGYRLRLAGEKVLLAPEAVARHEGSVSTGGRRSDFSLYHGARNRLWLYVKDTPTALLWPTLPFHLIATLGAWLRAVIQGHGKPVGRGLKDALGGLPDILRSRREIQARRRAPASDIAAMMVWSPASALARTGKQRRPSV
jgi:N-acetylglucosaminyl-diphospho-decaprenol L-rhamnosyltransferase